MPVALSEQSVSLSASASAELPLHPFELTATLAQHAALGGLPQAGVPIEICLYPLVGAVESAVTSPRTAAQEEEEAEAPSHGDEYMSNVPPSALLPAGVGGASSAVARRGPRAGGRGRPSSPAARA